MTILMDRETLNNGAAVDGTGAFRCDEEFRRLNPPLSAAELAELETLLVADGGAKDAFVVWQGQQLLLDGYNRAAICERLGLPFTTRLVSLPDRQSAQAWILRHQSGRRNLTPEGLAYLRGRRFHVEKGQPGGTGANQYRSKEQRGQTDTAARKTSRRLAVEFKVSPRTITRDAKFAAAVDVLAADAEEVKRLVLSRDARIRRMQAMRLANLPAEERRRAVQHLVETGELPDAVRRGTKPRILLPRQPKDFAEAVVRLLGLRQAQAIQEALTAAIRASVRAAQQGKGANEAGT
jgi:hypothetical protein